MANKENQSPIASPPIISKLSPNNKPALSRQRDHSACRKPDTPLKVRKTRENLKQHSVFTDIPPPCVHALGHDELPTTPVSSSATLALKSQNLPPARQAIVARARNVHEGESPDPESTASVHSETQIQRQKSVSRRMLSKVKQGIGNRSRSSQAVRPTESETSLVRRLSGRHKSIRNEERRSHSFEIPRTSIGSNLDDAPSSIEQQPSSVQRSFTDSTVSTAEVLGEQSTTSTPDRALRSQALESSGLSPIHLSPSPPSSSPPQPTPRPPPQKQLPPVPRPSQLSLKVPCVDLYVALSCVSVDLHSKQDVWVAVEATVRCLSSTITVDDAVGDRQRTTAGSLMTGANCSIRDNQQHDYGTISSLRLCFKAVGGCAVREVIGQKSAKDLAMGQQCSLFIKVHVPRIRIRDSLVNIDQGSLFNELESIVGTLKMEIFHVEARYRHTLLPSDNVVAVRHTCKVKRPKTESRWSVVGIDPTGTSSSNVLTQLAQYVAARYSAPQALDILQQYIGNDFEQQPVLSRIRDSLVEKLQSERRSEDLNPSVIVTDSDIDSAILVAPISEHYSTAPSTPAAEGSQHALSVQSTKSYGRSDSAVHLLGKPNAGVASLKSAARPAVDIRPHVDSTTMNNNEEHQPVSETQDSARQLWRHIRRSSLSAKQLEHMAPERLQHLETSDATMKELRSRALANKRSVGAETLRAWKWDETVRSTQRSPESPWM